MGEGGRDIEGVIELISQGEVGEGGGEGGREGLVEVEAETEAGEGGGKRGEGLVEVVPES